MSKHRTVRVVAVLIMITAVVYLLAGLAVAVALGVGWGGVGWSWLPAIPVGIGALSGALGLLVFGAILFLLARIETNTALARQQREAAREHLATASGAGVAAVAGIAAEADASAPEAVLPAMDAGEAGELSDLDAAPVMSGPISLPGSAEAARIAEEMRAAEPAAAMGDQPVEEQASDESRDER